MKVKSMLMVITAMVFMMFGTANAFHIDPVTGLKGEHVATTGAQGMMAGAVVVVFADAIAKSNAQGVLPCHGRKDVKVDKGGYVVYATDCEANGFK